MEALPKIYLFCIGYTEKDVIGAAISEDGCILTLHLSSNIEWLMYDLGLNSIRKHEIYQNKYRNGYDLVWVDSVTSTPEGFRKACELYNECNKELNDE